MNTENIIFGIIILAAVVYLGRKLFLFFVLKRPPQCSCCNSKCIKGCDEDNEKADDNCKDKQ